MVGWVRGGASMCDGGHKWILDFLMMKMVFQNATNIYCFGCVPTIKKTMISRIMRQRDFRML
jgi:hypothetical protein